jgi:molybdate transport system substrate-binding protein
LIALSLLALAQAVRAEEIRVFAAASLKEVVTELADGFEKSHPGVTVVRNFGASGALVRQIEAGAPADLFLSANREWADRLVDLKLADGKGPAILAYNVLVFAGRPETRAGGMKELPTLSKIAIGSPKSVPAGEYAVKALTVAGLYDSLKTKLVMARDVREALLYAERGEVDGAFVYRTDVRMSKGVKVLFEVPRELYPRVTCPGLLTKAGARKADAKAFFDRLRSDAGKASLSRHGFAVE